MLTFYPTHLYLWSSLLQCPLFLNGNIILLSGNMKAQTKSLSSSYQYKLPHWGDLPIGRHVAHGKCKETLFFVIFVLISYFKYYSFGWTSCVQLLLFFFQQILQSRIRIESCCYSLSILFWLLKASLFHFTNTFFKLNS